MTKITQFHLGNTAYVLQQDDELTTPVILPTEDDLQEPDFDENGPDILTRYL